MPNRAEASSSDMLLHKECALLSLSLVSIFPPGKTNRFPKGGLLDLSTIKTSISDFPSRITSTVAAGVIS